MDPMTEQQAREAQMIVSAMRELQANETLRSDAGRDLPAVLDRLGLSGVARSAVASAFTLSLTGMALGPNVKTMGWWI